MNKISIRKFRPSDAVPVCRLVRRTFIKFVTPECTKSGSKIWLAQQTPAQQIKRAKTRAVYVAASGKRIVGMIEIAPNRVSLLFVDSELHGGGIGQRLVRKALSIFKKRKTKIIKVFSSTYAMPFYQKIRFKRAGRKIRWKGIPSNPMKLRLK